MDDMYQAQHIHPHKKRLHVIMFSVFLVALCAMFIFNLGRIQASWQWGQLLNQDFWNTNPNDGNIIYSLYGDGSPGSTAYTRTWNTSCIPSTVTQLASTTGFTGNANTIYVLASGSYTLSSNIVLTGCSALVTQGDAYIDGDGQYRISLANAQHIIVDGVHISDSSVAGITISAGSNIAINGVSVYDGINNGLMINNASSYIHISNSQFTNNTTRGLGVVSADHVTLNNLMTYNNAYGIYLGNSSSYVSINNTQSFTNSADGVIISSGSVAVHNSTIYNNGNHGINFSPATSGDILMIDTTYAYNNAQMGLYGSTGVIQLYGAQKFFDNGVSATGGNVAWTTPTPPLSRSAGTRNISDTTNYDWFTNPINTLDAVLFTGTSWSSLRGIQSFDTSYQPLRYIFGAYIPRQSLPVFFDGTGLATYGADITDFDSSKYIAELLPNFTPAYMSIVQQYFGSGSLYTQNRSGNACSLGSFQIVTLQPSTSYATYTLQAQTIYLLEEGEYRFHYAGEGFVFGGNCIALIGSGNVRIDKDNIYVTNLLSATDKRNLIIDNIKLDGSYYGNGNINGQSAIGISFAGATHDTTINQAQIYNQAQYGVFYGVNSHHNTLINSQIYNNLGAGIYFYLASHHNVINNTMTYNNSGYGIRFANGSHRNAMNNFQSFNNTVGIYGDLTTQQNLVNRALLYNNSEYGLLLKNSSGNVLNDVRIYNNTTGIATQLNSYNNLYNGELTLFANGTNLEGTTANDGSLINTSASPFSAGTLSTGGLTLDCSFVTNPNLSGTNTYLLNTLSGCATTGWDYSVFNGWLSSLHYLFGANIYKQTLPYRYDGSNTLLGLSSQYDANKYIAEVFAIRDAIPDNMSFSFTGNEPNTLYISSSYTAYGINVSVPLSLTLTPNTTPGYLIINGTPSGTSGTITNGDTVRIALQSSASRYGFVSADVISNTTTLSTASLVTRGPDELPSSGSFAFGTLFSIPLATYTGSMTTVTDIETGVLASISTGRLQIYSGGALVSSGSTGIIYSGNTVLAIIQSSAQYSTANTGIITIGQGSGSLVIWTTPNITSPVLSFTDPVSSGAVITDTIAITGSGNSTPILYKFITMPGDCSASGAVVYTGSFTLTTETHNGKYVCAYTTLSGFDMPLVSQYTIRIDITLPTAPTLLFPSNGSDVFFLVFEWTGVYDSGAGISGYYYEIAEDYNFVDIVSTGFFASTTGNSYSPQHFDATDGDFYRRLRSIDRVGWPSAWSSARSFDAIDNTNFSFDEREYAALDTDYMSNDITIDGLRSNGLALASVDRGTLYKNSVARGSSSYVQNGDIVSIELTSPDDYDESITSTLTIANRQADFVITTAPDGDSCTLSTQDKAKIQLIYNSLIAQYSGNQQRYTEFLTTMRSMLQDEIDLTNDCNLQYLYDLLHGTLGQQLLSGIDLSIHIAPSCKQYRVSYDTGKVAFTSPDFRYATYFATRDALTRYIDSKNPGDCHLSSSPTSTWYFNNTDPSKHITPNGKVYTIQQETQGYSSAQLSSKRYFSSLAALRAYLEKHNPPYAIWSHTLDISFTPIIYTAPNGKEYRIYKTNRGYMSYKLMNVRYYTTLDVIKLYIDRNNPK